MTEQQAIEQLSSYKQIAARLHVLESYSIGSGITVSRLNQDDQLQGLHRQLRRLPSYMYLNQREQRLESVAHAYLAKYPAGARAQLLAVPRRGADPEDEKLLKELRRKIEKVIAARGYEMRDDLDAVLDRLAEYQELQDEIARIDTVLAALERYKPDYARLLRLRYVNGFEISEVIEQMQISRRTFERMRPLAVKGYCKLAV